MQTSRDGCDTPSQHPGYVQGTKPHLPTPKDNSSLRAQPSETFKVIDILIPWMFSFNNFIQNI